MLFPLTSPFFYFKIFSHVGLRFVQFTREEDLKRRGEKKKALCWAAQTVYSHNSRGSPDSRGTANTAQGHKQEPPFHCDKSDIRRAVQNDNKNK